MNTFESVFAPQKEFFQDDVFPETAVWWEAPLTAAAWLSGSNGQQRKISLRPKDMAPWYSSTSPKNNSKNTCPNICSMHVAYACNTIPFLMICFLSVSEAPKEAPVRKYLPSSVYLEEKTDDQKKDEVSLSVFLSFVCSFILYTGCLFVCLCLWVIHEIGKIDK